MEHISFNDVEFPCLATCPACVEEGNDKTCSCAKCAPINYPNESINSEGEATVTFYEATTETPSVEDLIAQNEVLKQSILLLDQSKEEMLTNYKRVSAKLASLRTATRGFFSDLIEDQHSDSYDVDDTVETTIDNINQLMDTLSVEGFESVGQWEIMGNVTFSFHVTIEAKGEDEARELIDSELCFSDPDIEGVEYVFANCNFDSMDVTEVERV